MIVLDGGSGRGYAITVAQAVLLGEEARLAAARCRAEERLLVVFASSVEAALVGGDVGVVVPVAADTLAVLRRRLVAESRGVS